MTLEELYAKIGGDYDQARRVLRMDKLIDKHIRKLTNNGVVEQLIKAGENMDPTQLFETAHAAKGVCANLGLKALSDMASAIADEFRPGNARALTDEQVKQRLTAVAELYDRTARGIQQYVEG